MSAILQCLLHCTSLQRYFLRDVGHDHESCAIYRSMEGLGNAPAFARGKSKQAMNVCLACEMDKIFLQNLSSTTGVDVLTAVSRRLPNEVFAPSSNGDKSRRTTLVKRGEPLIPSTMLTSVWKCGGMKHLAGYDQRDAHEFLHSFLEILGEHVKLYRSNVQKAINMARPDNAIQELNGVENSPQNEIKKLFEGTLRSVLICQSCGVKRAKPEPFMSISLPLSKEIQLMMANTGPDHSGVEKLSVELCLQHFTMPEKLSDPVHCPNCGKKTPTKKQHVVSKLPKILCLHLKRFDAATNKKIEEFVSFPSYGLNMGLYLPHWCELYRAVSLSSADVDGGFTPELQYDLFATVNHFGNLQSGHYVSNLKVGGKWYHCNDSHVSFAGADSGEAEVLKSEGAYVLFYMRR
jgi:ubiquitin C-terminal hydrolase